MEEIPNSGLKGKTCVVTGGAGTLCTVIAESLAMTGVHTIILDRDLQNARKQPAQ